MQGNDDNEEHGAKPNGSGLNGSGNGVDKGDDKVVHFPTLAERDRARKEKEKQEKAWKKEYRAQQKASEAPFFNMDKILPFVKVMVPALLLIHVVSAFLLTETQAYWLIINGGFISAKLTTDFTPLALLTPFSYMLLHADWMHVAVNTLMLAALGTAFERDFGTRPAIIFFVICGLAGAGLHLLLNPFSTVPVIGASGAVSGFFASFLMIAHWRGAVPLRGKWAQYGVWPLVALWVFLIVGLGLLIGGPSLSWEAHLGGFIIGLFLTSKWARRRWAFWR